MKFLFILPFLISLQNVEEFMIGNWKVIEEDGVNLEEDFFIDIFKDHQIFVTRGNRTDKTNWRLIQGKRSNLLMISDEEVFGLEIHADTLFLLSETGELTLIRKTD